MGRGALGSEEGQGSFCWGGGEDEGVGDFRASYFRSGFRCEDFQKKRFFSITSCLLAPPWS